jgi:hypothetical protein
MSAAEALKAARGRCRKPQAAGSRFSVNVGLLDGPLEPASKKSRIGGSFLPAPRASRRIRVAVRCFFNGPTVQRCRLELYEGMCVS